MSRRGGEGAYGFKADLAIENTTGQVLGEAKDVFTISTTKRRDFSTTLSFGVPYLRPGEYKAAFTVRDQNSDKDRDVRGAVLDRIADGELIQAQERGPIGVRRPAGEALSFRAHVELSERVGDPVDQHVDPVAAGIVLSGCQILK